MFCKTRFAQEQGEGKKFHSVPRIESVRQGALRLAPLCTSPYIHESDLVA